MAHITAIWKKQLKDTVKNKTVLIQFLLFPLMTVVMEHSIKMRGMPEHFFVVLFAAMYIGMAPLTSMASILSEEKEKNTLRVLIMANVKPREYLIGIGFYVWFFCMIGSGVICMTGGYDWKTSFVFMGIMAAGIATSLLIGAVIGLCSRSEMMATSTAVPVMMILSFAPMLSLFNETIGKLSRFLYTEQVSRMLFRIDGLRVSPENIAVMAANGLAAAVVFVLMFRQCRLG